jgi:hypothetical protein
MYQRCCLLLCLVLFSQLSFAQTEVPQRRLKDLAADSKARSAGFWCVDNQVAISTSGYDFVKSFGKFGLDSYPHGKFTAEDSVMKEEISIGSKSVFYIYSRNTQRVTLACKGLASLTMDLQPLLDNLPVGTIDCDPALLTLTAENAQWKAKLCYQCMQVVVIESQMYIRQADALLMLSMKDEK